MGEEPGDPVDPVDPVDPEEPVDSVDPAEPVDSAKSGATQGPEAKGTGLPNTGNSATGETSVALMAAVAGAVALTGTGLAMRLREDRAA